MNYLSPILVTVIFGILYWVLQKNVVGRLAELSTSHLDDALVPSFLRWARLGLFIGYAVFLAGAFGLDITAPLAGVGFFGLAVSFAIRPTIQRFFGTLEICRAKLFDMGDTISMKGFKGKVVRMTFTHTTLNMVGGGQIKIPNSKLANEVLEVSE